MENSGSCQKPRNTKPNLRACCDGRTKRHTAAAQCRYIMKVKLLLQLREAPLTVITVSTKSQPQISHRKQNKERKHGEKIRCVLYNIGKDPEEDSKSCCITRETWAASSSSPQALREVGKVDAKPTPTQTIKKKRSQAGLKERWKKKKK